MRICFVGYVLSVALALPSAQAHSGPSYTLTDLGTLGGTQTFATGVNNAGQVVGRSHTTGDFTEHAFISGVDGSALKDLGTLGGAYSEAWGINNSGEVAGDSTLVNAPNHAFISGVGGALKDLGTLGGPVSWGYAINDVGQVVGVSETTNNYYDLVPHAFISGVNGGPLKDLGTLSGYTYSRARGINNSGQVVGDSSVVNGPLHAFISGVNGGALKDLGTLGGANSIAFGINNSGQVVGQSSTTTSAAHAFIYDGGVLRDLGTLGGTLSGATAINNAGQVVGFSTININEPFQHVFVTRANGGAMIDLGVLPGLTLPNLVPESINDYAQIVIRDNDSSRSFLFTPHPAWSATGNGIWDDPQNWSFAGLGSFGITPGRPHDVTISPTVTSTITGPSGNVQIHSLTLGGDPNALATLSLSTGTIASTNGVTINNNGILTGSGSIQGNVINNAGGLISVGPGMAMQLAGTAHTNAGMVRILGTALNPSSLQVVGNLANQSNGQIFLQNATATFGGGLNNDGLIGVTFGTSNVFGPITNNATGKVIVTGNSNATFYGDIANNGELRVSSGSAAVFFGNVGGAGQYTGTGESLYEAGFHVGNSPAVVTLNNDVTFDSSSVIDMDIGGTTPGNCDNCHAQLIFTNHVTFDTGILELELWKDFEPHAGDIFDLFQYSFAPDGQFGTLELPNLGPGLVWDSSALYTTGEISVRVREPTTLALLGIAFAGIALARRRKLN